MNRTLQVKVVDSLQPSDEKIAYLESTLGGVVHELQRTVPSRLEGDIQIICTGQQTDTHKLHLAGHDGQKLRDALCTLWGIRADRGASSSGTNQGHPVDSELDLAIAQS